MSLSSKPLAQIRAHDQNRIRQFAIRWISGFQKPYKVLQPDGVHEADVAADERDVLRDEILRIALQQLAHSAHGSCSSGFVTCRLSSRRG